MCTKALNRVMNYYSKIGEAIMILPMIIDHEGTISTLLLVVVKHHQKKRKVVPLTGFWDILLKAKSRYYSWWPKIKLLCKMTWKRTRQWPYFYFIPSGSNKWYFFSTCLCNWRALINCWEKMCNIQKWKSALLWHIANMMNHHA